MSTPYLIHVLLSSPDSKYTFWNVQEFGYARNADRSMYIELLDIVVYLFTTVIYCRYIHLAARDYLARSNAVNVGMRVDRFVPCRSRFVRKSTASDKRFAASCLLVKTMITEWFSTGCFWNRGWFWVNKGSVPFWGVGSSHNNKDNSSYQHLSGNAS